MDHLHPRCSFCRVFIIPSLLDSLLMKAVFAILNHVIALIDPQDPSSLPLCLHLCFLVYPFNSPLLSTLLLSLDDDIQHV